VNPGSHRVRLSRTRVDGGDVPAQLRQGCAIHGGATHTLDIDGANGTFTVEWKTAPGGVTGVTRVEGSDRTEWVFRDGDFVKL